MKDPVQTSRRRLLTGTLGLAAAAASARISALSTPTQTEGPFFPNRPQPDTDADMTMIEGHSERASGEIVEISGRVLDEDGQPIAEAVVDVWQANAQGRYAHESDPNPSSLDPNFQGWAQLKTDASGRYRFKTIKPGAYPVMDDWSRPPHIHFKVARRGFEELTTQMYFSGDPLNNTDRLLQSLEPAERDMLIVNFSAAADGAAGQFDLVLRRVG